MSKLLLPAGNLLKLKFAVLYGGDEVYLGGKNFSLRNKADNFTLDEIEEGVKFAHSYNKKVYVTVNVVIKNNLGNQIVDYLRELEKRNVDGVIVSSLFLIQKIKELGLKLEVHLSTQVSCMNKEAMKFFVSLGVKRIVLARECTLDNIISLSKENICDIEVFIHGGMCSSISGRCSLSDHLCLRGANDGLCAHSCRWKYYLSNDIEKKDPFVLGVKDLMGIEIIDKLASYCQSFKVEGRMKSEYYVAKIGLIYSKALRLIKENKYDENSKKELLKALLEIENRPLSLGYLKNNFTSDDIIDLRVSRDVNHSYLGYIDEVDQVSKTIKIVRKNDFKNNEIVRVIPYDREPFLMKIEDLRDEDSPVNVASKTEKPYYVNLNTVLKPLYILEKYE